MSNYLDQYFSVNNQANLFYETTNRFYETIQPILTAINVTQNLEAFNSFTNDFYIRYSDVLMPIINQIQQNPAPSFQTLLDFMGTINSTSSVIASISIDFSAILLGTTFQGEYAELDEKATEALSHFADIVPEEISEPLPVIKTIVSNPASTDRKIPIGQLVGILLTIFFGILTLVQNEIHHAHDSAAQQQQWQTENEHDEVIIDYLKQIMANPEENSADHLPPVSEFQEAPAVPDSVPLSDDSNP